MDRRLPWFPILVALLSFAASAVLVPPVVAGDSAVASDPVVAEVVRLLDARLGEPLIVRWLEESGKAPADVSADDLVALKGAQASDQLIATLLDLAKSGVRKAVPAPAADPTPAPPAPARSKEALTPPARAPAAVAPAATAPATPAAAPVAAAEAGGTVLVSATLRYVHVADEGEAWNLVVYLDGVPFPPLSAAPSEATAVTQTGERRLPPGRHVLRWAQERHRKRPEEQGLHAARFDPEALVFEVAAGGPVEIAFEFRDRSGMFRRFGPPVTVNVKQDGREVAALRPESETYHWGLLCEDYEANLAGKKPGFDDRRTLRNCLRWADLWKDASSAPGRDAVRPPVQ